jgi:hypothetical protein
MLGLIIHQVGFLLYCAPLYGPRRPPTDLYIWVETLRADREMIRASLHLSNGIVSLLREKECASSRYDIKRLSSICAHTTPTVNYRMCNSNFVQILHTLARMYRCVCV